MGTILVAVGDKYRDPSNSTPSNSSFNDTRSETDTDTPNQQEEDPCPNGASHWMYVSGILLLVTSFISGVAQVWNQNLCTCTAHPEKIVEDKNWEKWTDVVLKIIICLMYGVIFAMMIWGSVVVFGAWPKWTDNPDVHEKDPSRNYCEKTPMVTAFVILIIMWVLFPCVFMVLCCSGCIMAWTLGTHGTQANPMISSDAV